MSAQLDPQEAPDLDDLQVRVVQLDQLGAARKQPRPEPAS